MILEDYCSYEISKLLKEKGFDTFKPYGWDEELFDTEYPRNFSISFDSKEHWISCPTHQTAMKWLREVHNKHCDIGYDLDLGWFFQIVDLKETVEYDYPEAKYYHIENEIEFNTYEEAVEAALKYVLENLI